MREKYIEERFPRYFEFGSNYSTGKVDVASIHGDVCCGLHITDSNRLILDRDLVIDMLIKVTQALNEVDPEKLKDIWYT